jgi:hypothetical protein
MLVIDLADGVGAEFAKQECAECRDAKSFLKTNELNGFRHVVLFLNSRARFAEVGEGRLSLRERAFFRGAKDDVAACQNVRVIDHLAGMLRDARGIRICVVSSFTVHFDDAALLAVERRIVERFEQTSAQLTILRTGHLLTSNSPLVSSLRRFAPLHPLAPRRLRSCFLDPGELFAAIQDVLAKKPGRRVCVLTLLGQNMRLRNILETKVPSGPIPAFVTVMAYLLAWLGLGQLVGLAFLIAARACPRLRTWQFDTLTLGGAAELLTLVNPYNRRHVAIAGYNTGVVHFGWQWPGKTVVKTVGSGHQVRLRRDSVVVDAGVTLKRTAEMLRQAGRELCVTPNYSYISMGTTFFVPVHGSACEVSTLGETINKIWLYDPCFDRLMVLRRDDPRFAEAMYNPSSGLLALRLELRVQPKRHFVVDHSALDSPTAAEMWRLLAERSAANIEVRKARASARQVDVYRYYPASPTDGAALDAAQDAVGRIWDRLEENAVTSFTFHALIRRFGFHVELFLDEQEFGVFWDAHTRLPLSKIQLRFIRRDNLPHSPCGRRDCISADLFMLRAKSAAFLNFVHEQLPHARFNPGKHST